MKIGDYARYNGKIYKISEIGYVNNKPFSFMSNEDGWFMLEDSKTSPNIIDLIKVGDYVNGYQVIEKPYMYHDIQFVSVDTQDSWSWGKGEMPVENIKSIVTKEQFEAIKYEIK